MNSLEIGLAKSWKEYIASEVSFYLLALGYGRATSWPNGHQESFGMRVGARKGISLPWRSPD